MPSTTKAVSKVGCINPNTGRHMNIDASTYDLFLKAIYHALKDGKALTFTQMVEGVEDCLRQQKTMFDGSIPWYTISVKNDLQAKGVIEVLPQKGKKLLRLNNK